MTSSHDTHSPGRSCHSSPSYRWWGPVMIGLGLCAGCGGTVETAGLDPTGGQGAGSTVQSAAVEFTPAGTPAAGSIWLELGSIDEATGTFRMLVKGDGFGDAFGVAGRLGFDTSVCQLRSATTGDALAGGGAELLAAGTGNEAGGVFGVTRSGSWQSGSNIVRHETIGSLVFEIGSAGTTDLAFVGQRSKVMSPLLEPVEVSRWIGGTLTVR